MQTYFVPYATSTGKILYSFPDKTFFQVLLCRDKILSKPEKVGFGLDEGLGCHHPFGETVDIVLGRDSGPRQSQEPNQVLV